MRITPYRFIFLLTVTALSFAALTLGGCSDFRYHLARALVAEPPAHTSFQNETVVDETDDFTKRMTQAAQDHAQSLNHAIDRHNSAISDSHPMDEMTHIQWIDPAQKSNRSSKKPAQPVVDPLPSETIEVAAAPTLTKLPPEPAEKPIPIDKPTPIDRSTLLKQLQKDIRQSQDPALKKAITSVALSLVDPGRPLDRSDLSHLNPAQQALVERYHKLIVSITQDLVFAKDTLEREEVVEHINTLYGEQPISIRTANLCKRVKGYGNYETFEPSVFLSGREQPMIVYVELDHFRAIETPSGRFQVDLAQEVILYNQSDGLAVWRQPEVEITDESRNKRRDFFVVQMIRLPARLGVGKYLLKIRITDQHGGSLDEATMPIQIVADLSLVSGSP